MSIRGVMGLLALMEVSLSGNDNERDVKPLRPEKGKVWGREVMEFRIELEFVYTIGIINFVDVDMDSVAFSNVRGY